MGRAVWRVTEKPKIGIFGPGPVLAKPPFGIGRPIPTSQNSQLAGYLGGSDSVAMSGGDRDHPEVVSLHIDLAQPVSRLVLVGMLVARV